MKSNQTDSEKLRVLFAGGGTLGSVTPLLAVKEMIEESHTNTSFYWIGTRSGPERDLIEKAGIPFIPIFGGKLRRYFDVRNFLDPILLAFGIAQSLYHIIRLKPDLIVNAGSYIGVPVVFSGSLRNIKSIVFQLDVVPSISNLLCANFADAIGLAFKESTHGFPKKKSEHVGVPVRKAVYEWRELKREEARRKNIRANVGIHDELPFVLVLGGGTGAQTLNELTWGGLEKLMSSMHIVHVTGKNKNTKAVQAGRYHAFEFLVDDLIPLMACADLVVTRAGLGTLSELSVLETPSIVIPISNSHQEKNAELFAKSSACVYLSQAYLDPTRYANTIIALMSESARREDLSCAMAKVFPDRMNVRVASFVEKQLCQKK